MEIKKQPLLYCKLQVNLHATTSFHKNTSNVWLVTWQRNAEKLDDPSEDLSSKDETDHYSMFIVVSYTSYFIFNQVLKYYRFWPSVQGQWKNWGDAVNLKSMNIFRVYVMETLAHSLI